MKFCSQFHPICSSIRADRVVRPYGLVGVLIVDRFSVARKDLAGVGVDGVALVSAIFAADDIESECRLLRKLSEEMVNA